MFTACTSYPFTISDLGIARINEFFGDLAELITDSCASFVALINRIQQTFAENLPEINNWFPWGNSCTDIILPSPGDSFAKRELKVIELPGTTHSEFIENVRNTLLSKLPEEKRKEFGKHPSLKEILDAYRIATNKPSIREILAAGLKPPQLSDNTLYEIIAAFDAAGIPLFSMELNLMTDSSWENCLTIPDFRIQSLGFNLDQSLPTT